MGLRAEWTPPGKVIRGLLPDRGREQAGIGSERSVLPAVNVMLRKIAVAAASKPAVEIRQDGESFYIKTSTTVRTTEISFTVGQDFTEQTVDGRPCRSSPCWDTDSRIHCAQTLLKGEGPQTSWTREITNDGELILTMRADDVICTRVYTRE
ncbi:cellular retinoic acid-binding protein 2-like isoform X1 [Acipenser ruthenus]|uniref:cellular retinoic acid-binding protein 2-like isoform X1 n=1 Tax=Acipenser ruthenus TaxID=7906 RepID=UPI002740A6AE|nr:cellular retinoic acid-binding protein 2-like isoform X1 [Acipenser ruthenus]